MPYLNLDDGYPDHPKVDALSDAAFRELMRQACHWSKAGEVGSDLLAELIDDRRVRRAPRHWLPDAIAPRLRHRRKIPSDVRQRVYERANFACLHCGASNDLTLDHKVPWSMGGGDEESNLQTLCRRCNARKGART